MSLILTEIIVFKGSPFIGKTLGEIVKEYNVKIPHYHNPTLSPCSRTPYAPNVVIKKRFAIKATGPEDNLYRLMNDSI